MTHNDQGLPKAVDLDDFSGRAAQQIYFYLTARPIGAGFGQGACCGQVPKSVLAITP
jgi:hypothetical protein